jgi:hypothetical protein
VGKITSNRKRKWASRMLYSMIRSEARQNIELEDDPLGRLYEVNRYNLRVGHTDRGWLISVRLKMIDHLRAEGWSRVPTEWTERFRSPKNEIEVTVGDVYALPVRGYRFEVGVW